MKTVCSLIVAMLVSTSVAADEKGDERTNFYYAYPQAVCPDPAYGLAEVRQCVASYIAGAGRDLYRVRRSMKQVRWRNAELVRRIRAGRNGNPIAPDLYGASNLDIPEYPKPKCVEPIAESEVEQYHSCIRGYLEAAEDDDERIRQTGLAAHRYLKSRPPEQELPESTPFLDGHAGLSNRYDPRYPKLDCFGPETPRFEECVEKYIEAANNDQQRVIQSMSLARWRNDEVIRAVRGIDVQELLSRGPYPISNLDYPEYPEPGCLEPADEYDLLEYHDCIRAYLEAAENDVQRIEEDMRAARRLRIQAEKADRVID